MTDHHSRAKVRHRLGEDAGPAEPGDRPSPEAQPQRPAGEKTRLLVIDDDPLVRHLFGRLFADTEVEVSTAASSSEGLEMVRTRQPDVVVLDVILPDRSGLKTIERIVEIDRRLPVIFITSVAASETAIEAMKLGAYDFFLKPLAANVIRQTVSRAAQIRRFMHAPTTESDTSLDPSSEVLVGRCPAMQQVYKAIGRVASQNVTVLIRGESGTGKELVARAIYQHSARSQMPFLAVNCAAIPEPLLESELFGHEKGAYTGADTKRIGKFEQCSGGTLFLDEVGDMSPLVQSKALRLLQEQAFERVGGNETIHTDVRILAATNCDLEQMVAAGKFRADLYYRLNGFTIEIPPLRQRPEDVMALVEHLLARFSRELNKDVRSISPEAFAILLRYRWPGNVRELQSVLRQALLHATGTVLVPEFLPDYISARSASADGQPRREAALGDWESFLADRMQAHSEDLYAESLTMMERFLIARVLRHTAGNQSQAAKMLGITRGCLRNKIRSLGISIDQVVSIGDESAEAELRDAREMSAAEP